VYNFNRVYASLQMLWNGIRKSDLVA